MLTRSGWVVSALAITLLGSGVLVGYPELVALGTTAALALGTALGCALARTRVDFDRELCPERVPEGQVCLAMLRVTNTGRRRSLPMIVLDRVEGREIAVAVPSVPGGGERTVAYPLPALPRGFYTVGPVVEVRGDPLRLLHLRGGGHPRTRLHVHPRTHIVPALPGGRGRDRDAPPSPAPPVSEGSFESLREYVPGDDPRAIHWRSTARTGRLMVRHDVPPCEPDVVVLLDVVADSYDSDDDFEDAVRIAGSLIRAAWVDRRPVRLGTTSGGNTAVEPGQGEVGGLLDALARASRRDGEPELRLSRPGGSSPLTVVTGRPQKGTAQVLRSFSAGFEEVTLVSVVPQAGPAPLDVPGALVLDVRNSAHFVQVWTRGEQR